MPNSTSDAEISALLRRVKTIALVGASARPERASHEVMRFLQSRGYRVIPVNPGLAGETLLGERVRGSLSEIEERIDMVDLFRRSEAVGPFVDEAIRIGGGAVWMQLNVIDEAAAARARAAGLVVVMDRCPKIELTRMDRESAEMR